MPLGLPTAARRARLHIVQGMATALLRLLSAPLLPPVTRRTREDTDRETGAGMAGEKGQVTGMGKGTGTDTGTEEEE